MKFFVKYLIVAVVASCATYFGAPFLKPFLPCADAEKTDTGEVAVGIAANDVGPSGEASASPAENGAPFSETAKPVRTANVPRIPESAQRPAPSPAQEKPTAQPVAEPAYDGPVASTDHIPQSCDGVKGWAVAVRDADVALTGGRKARIQAGTLVEETATTGEGDEEAAVCQVWSDGRWSGPAKISTFDLFRVPGTRADIAADDVDLLCRFYRVKGDLAAAKKAAVAPDRALIDANPHAEEYRRLYREQQAFENRAEELKNERDNSTGAKRMKASDQLRSMMHEQQALDKKIAEIDKKYKAWKKAHANDPAIAAKADAQSKKLDALQDEFDALAQRVAPFGAQ